MLRVIDLCAAHCLVSSCVALFIVVRCVALCLRCDLLRCGVLSLSALEA